MYAKDIRQHTHTKDTSMKNVNKQDYMETQHKMIYDDIFLVKKKEKSNLS